METTNAPAVSGRQLVTGPTPTLLELQGIRKVFYTDEVETHALSDVHLAVRTKVHLGRSSVSTIEVREGLAEGDVVVLSDMNQYDNAERVRLR